jgi:hypothetical protein
MHAAIFCHDHLFKAYRLSHCPSNSIKLDQLTLAGILESSICASGLQSSTTNNQALKAGQLRKADRAAAEG